MAIMGPGGKEWFVPPFAPYPQDKIENFLGVRKDDIVDCVEVEAVSLNPLDRQVGGDHYKKMPIQPSEYITKNGLGWYEGNAIKYITRHRMKGEKKDIEKAIHYLELLLNEYK